MKLLYCPLCGDAVRLVSKKWRRCGCKESGGQYNADLMTATIGGEARVFGVGNPFFNPLWGYLDDAAKRRFCDENYKQVGSCWWGEYSGEQQIFRIKDAAGPRLSIKISASLGAMNHVTVTDRREYCIDGKWYMEQHTVSVPANPRPSSIL